MPWKDGESGSPEHMWQPGESGNRRSLWKPGQSGNPDGRPKGGRKNFGQIARNLLEQETTDGKVAWRGVMQKLIDTALTGDVNATRLLALIVDGRLTYKPGDSGERSIINLVITPVDDPDPADGQQPSPPATPPAPPNNL